MTRPSRSSRSAHLVTALLATSLLLTGCTGITAGEAAVSGPAATGGTRRADGPAGGPGGGSGERDAGQHTRQHAGQHAGRSAPPPPPPAPRELPGLGPETRAAVPDTTHQAVVVTGAGWDANRSEVTVYERDPLVGWVPVSAAWSGHNALRGWTDDHSAGDLRSPIGVFGLTDAGGRLPDPGSRLPYEQHAAFELSGIGFEGENLEGSFDYVVAIDYNRTPGTTPLDPTRPLGADRGGGIWIHVDHGGPTHGCVSLPIQRMKELLRTLDPRKRPVVVMGDATSLAR